MNISSRYSGLSGSAKHVKSQIAVGRKDDTVHAILEEVEEWKQKKLFWRLSDLGRRHVKVVYYFAPIKSEIFYNSDCYERVRKFVILKVHRIAIFFFHRGSWTYCILTHNYRVGSCQRQVTLTWFHSSNYWNQNFSKMKPASEATSIISTSYRMQISLLRL